MLTTECLAEKDVLVVKLELTSVAHAADLEVPRVVRSDNSFGIGAHRRGPQRSGCFVVQGLVRPVVVVVDLEPVELPLLPPHAGRGRSSRLSLECAMHALMGTVLLWTRGRDALVDDAELHPPNVQLTESVDAGRRKGHAVVASNGVWQAHLAEQILQCFPRTGGAHVWQATAAQQVSAVVIKNGQRVTVDAIACAKLTLEVHRPDLVGRICSKDYSAWVLPSRSMSPRLDESMAFQNVEYRASTWHFGFVESPFQQPVKLPCAPAVSLLETDYQVLGCLGCSMRASERRSTALHKPSFSERFKSVRPFVSGWPRDAVVLAELAHRPPSGREVSHKTRSFLHRTRLLPRHPRTCKRCPRTGVKYLPRLYLLAAQPGVAAAEGVGRCAPSRLRS